VRLDKFLWCVRLSKTRSIAAKSCQANQILVNGIESKPSRVVKEKDIISVKMLPIWKTFKVREFPRSRVGAKLVETYIFETTAKDELAKLEEFQLNQRYNKSLGLKGRPTKKDRRDISDYTE
jgi:ribosome-associated heat shock protein Hsp15